MTPKTNITLTKTSNTGRILRIQVTTTPSGYVISNAVETTDKAPKDLSVYGGGWDLYPKRVYTTQAAALKRLTGDGWQPR